jgi:hypothetical protein
MPLRHFNKITNDLRTEWGARPYAGICTVLNPPTDPPIGTIKMIRLTLAGKLILVIVFYIIHHIVVNYDK